VVCRSHIAVQGDQCVDAVLEVSGQPLQMLAPFGEYERPPALRREFERSNWPMTAQRASCSTQASEPVGFGQQKRLLPKRRPNREDLSCP